MNSRYATPSPRYPDPSPTSLDRLIATWERLRALDIEGYRTSAADPMSTWLVQVNWAGGKVSPRSPGRGTTCSPFTTQSAAMAYSAEEDSPYAPRLSNGEALPLLFCRSANGNLSAAHQKEMDAYGMTLADNGWPRAIIFFNMGYAIDPTQLRRGDAVHIDWASGGGHAVFCWDVHLNARGQVDAFQFVSSNGRITVNGSNAGAGAGVSVGGTPLGEDGFIRQVSANPPRYEALRAPLFTDDDRYVAEGTWVTWHKDLTLADLGDCRVRPRGRLARAQVVKAARLHGVTPPAPYAMGAGAPLTLAAPPLVEDTRELQRRLKLLAALGWIHADPGAADGVMGPRTERALRDFQAENRLAVDGVPGPRTWAKLRAVCELAGQTPPGRLYLATGSTATARDLGERLPRVKALYFRHGAVRAGEALELVLVARGLDGEPLRGVLREAGSAACLSEFTLTPKEGRASVTLRPPATLRPGTPLLAEMEALHLTTRAAAVVL